MQEQLDIERERVSDLLQHVLGKKEDDEEDSEPGEQVRKDKSWTNQKLRLMNKANKEYVERMKENVQEKEG